MSFETILSLILRFIWSYILKLKFETLDMLIVTIKVL